MEEHVLWITALLNSLFGKPVAAILSAMHIQPENAAYPIPNHVSMEILVFAVAIVFFLWLKGRLSVERPGATQQCMEMILTNPLDLGVLDLLENNVGHNGRSYLSMLGSIGIFVLMCNLISLIPTLESPTAQISVPFGLAVVVFIYYNYSGIRKHGAFTYVMHFTGPEVPLPPPFSWIISLIIFVIELISNFARLLSLTVRLWVNMFVSELLYGIFLGLLLELFLFLGHLNFTGYIAVVLPFALPIAFIVLHIFVGVLQAFVFTILPVIYVSGAVGEEH